MDDNQLLTLMAGGTYVPHQSWWADAADSFLVESPIDDFASRARAKLKEDDDFDPYEDGYLKGYEGYLADFQGVKNKAHADSIKYTIDRNNQRRIAMSASGRWFPQMVGAIATPENLALAALVPIGRAGSLLKASAKTGGYIGASELAMEVGLRRPADPTRTLGESAATVGAGALFGGAFHVVGGGLYRGAQRLRTNAEMAEVEKALNQQLKGMTGQPDALHIGEGEDLFVALQSSGYSGDTPILRNDAGYEGSTASARAISADGTQTYMKAVMRDLIKAGYAKADDDLVVAYQSAARAKKGKAAWKPFFDLLDERILKSADPAVIFGADQNVLGARGFANQAANNVEMRDLRRLQRPTQDGYISYSEKKMYDAWEKLVKEDGGSPDRILTTRGLKPLSEFGIEKFENFNDYREFILRHELWHQATANNIANKGRKRSLAKRNEEEDFVNAQAAKDFKAWRQSNQKLREVEYKGAVMRAADGAFGGYISKTQNKVADFMQQRAANNPMASVFRRAKSNLANDVARIIAGDQSLVTTAQLTGRAGGTSIQTGNKVWVGKAVETQNLIREQYNAYVGLPEKQKLAYVQTASTFQSTRPKGTITYDQFLEDVGRTLLSGVPHQSTQINKAVNAVNDFYKWGLVEAQNAGIMRMQTGEDVRAAILEIEYDMERVNAALLKAIGADQEITPTAVLMFNENAKKQDATWRKIKKFRDDNPELVKEFTFMSRRRSDLLDEEQYIKSMSGKEANDYMRRVYNTEAIRTHRELFTDMVHKSFLRNPNVWVKGKGWVTTDAQNARERAEDAVRRILGEDDVDQRFSGGPGAMRHRTIPMSNSELVNITVDDAVFDFIQVDPVANVMNYAHNVGSYAEFAKRFRTTKSYLTPDEAYEQVMSRVIEAEKKAGNDPQTIDKIERDMRFLKNAVTHRIVTNPDSMSREVVAGLKNLTHLTTMGGSGITAANEIASIHLVHGFKRLMKAVQTQHGANLDAFMRRHESELTRMGTLTDVALGVSNMRFDGGMFESSLRTAPNRFLQKTASKMFIFNGMGPITMKLKSLTGVISIDRTLGGIADEFNIRGRQGTRADDVEYAKTLDMSEAMRRRVANMLDENWDDIYHPEDDIFSVDTREWSDAGAARAFQEHIAADIENVILMANPSTKWKVMDGVVHVPSNSFTDGILANRAGVRLDGGYYRLEHPLLSLPFMYLSWPLASANKVMGRMVRSEYASPIGFMLSAVALSYFVQEFKGFTRSKNRGFIPFDQKIANAVYYSNISNILADYYDKSSWIATAVARDMGYEDFDARVPNLRFLDVQGTTGEIMDIATGPSISKLKEAGMTVVGASEDWGNVIRTLPFNQLPFLAQLYDMIEAALEE